MKNTCITDPLYITGICPATKQLMLGGIFRMHDQVGYPVDCCIDESRERGFMIDWLEALCACWLNDCLKFPSFARQAELASREPLNLHHRFKVAGAVFLGKFPKARKNSDPVNVFCRYILEKKRKGACIIFN